MFKKKELEFDIEKLKSTKEKCENLATEINDLKDILLEELNQLKKDWNTDAGKVFFAEQDTDWTSQVNKYVEITNTISKLLDTAITNYQELVDDAQRLNL